MSAQDEAASTSTPAEGGSSLVRLKVKTMEPANYDLHVPRTTTIGVLKSEHLEPLVNAPAERQRIIFKGRALQDEQTLQEASLEDNDTLHLVIRPADAPPAPSVPHEPNANTPNPGPAGLFLPGGAVNLLQSLMSAVGAQPGSIQINTMGPMTMGNPLQGLGLGQQAPARTQPGNNAQQQSGTAANQTTGANANAPSLQQQPFPGWNQELSDSPPWVQAPHLVSVINSFLESLQSPNFVPPQMPLAWHPITPTINQGVALSRLTDGLRDVLQGVYLPSDLRSLMEASQGDREGLAPATGLTAATATGGAVAGTAPVAAPAAGPGPTTQGMTTVLANARPGQQIPDFSNYRYLPLAVAALAELTRRADIHISSCLTPRMRELSGSIMALAADPRNRAVEQQVQLLCQHLSSSAALLTELGRLATGLGSALQGNAAPLVFSRPAMVQPAGSTYNLPILQPSMSGIGLPGTPGLPAAFHQQQMLMQQLQRTLRGTAGGVPQVRPPPPQGGAAEADATAGAGAGAGADAVGQPPAAGGPALPGGAPLNMQSAIRIDIVDDGSGGDISATLGPLLNSMLGPMMGGAAMPDMTAVFQQHQQQVNQQRMQQQQQQQPTAATGAAAAVPPAGSAASPAQPGSDQPAGEVAGNRGQLNSYMSLLSPLIRMISSSAANTVSQRLVPLQPLLQSPSQTGELVRALVSEVLNEAMSSVVETWATHEDRINAALQQMESREADGPAGLQEMVRQVQALVGNIVAQPPGRGQSPATTTAVPGAPASRASAPGAPEDSTAAATPGQEVVSTAAPDPTSTPPSSSTSTGGPSEGSQLPDSDSSEPAAKKPRAAATAAGEAAAARALAAATAVGSQVPDAAPAPAPAPVAEAPASQATEVAAGVAGSAAPQAASSSRPATSGPRGLGLGLKPIAKRKPAATSQTAALAPADETATGEEGARAAAGSRPATGAGTAGSGAGSAPDMGNLMAMVGRMMSGTGGAQAGSAAGAGAGAGGALGNILGGAGGPGGGLGGLMQMANSIASDPAMQPMLQSAMSSLMAGSAGGGMGGGGAGGPAGGLGGLLSSLMGGMAGTSAAQRRSTTQVEELLELDKVLEEELDPEDAARWRRIIEQDEVLQARMEAVPAFSEVYQAGLPQRSISMMDRLATGAEQRN